MRKFNFNQAINYQPFKLNDFLGVDFANDPSEVNIKRSPDAKNAIASENNVVEKRTGYQVLHTFASGAKINGIHVRKGNNIDQSTHLYDLYCKFIHVGTQLWVDNGIDAIWQVGHVRATSLMSYPAQYATPMYIELPDTPCLFIECSSGFYIIGGGQVLKYFEVKLNGGDVSLPCFANILTSKSKNDSYVPTTSIARSPTGGGETYEAINVMQSKRKNSFLGTSVATAYQLDATALDAIVVTDDYGLAGGGTVTADILQANGSYVTITEGAGLTVNRTTGVVTFSVAPGVTPITGQDNIIITFYKTNATLGADLGYARAFAFFGMNGSDDYLFLGNCGFADLSNNPFAVVQKYELATKSNYDYYGRSNDFYFADTAYTRFGSNQSEIMGYSRLGEYLAIHNKSNTEDKTLFLRSASLDANNEIIFPVRQGLSGVDAISMRSFNVLRDDPLFLSQFGVVAMNTNAITNTQSLQDRGYYINKRLMQEANLDYAVSVVHDNKYMLFVNGHVYVADPRKKYSDKNAVSESYQYEWYYWEGIDARAVCSYEGVLYFGTTNGKLCTMRQKGTAHAYLDNDTPVIMYWCTPVLFFNDITVKKSLKNLWIRFAQYMRSGVKVYYRVRGEIKFVKEKVFDVFTFEDIDFTRMTFETDLDPEVIVTNRVERQFMSIQFKVLNDADENMGLIEMVAKYRTNSAYKGG